MSVTKTCLKSGITKTPFYSVQETYLNCHQCAAIFEKNAKTITKLVWGGVPP